MSGLPRKSLPPDDLASIDRRSGKPKRVTPKVRKAVRLMLGGTCQTMKAAAERVGVSPEYISRAMRQPHVQQYVDTEARACLATGKLAASARLLELLHAQSEHVSFDAAKHTLAVNGIRPEPDQNLAINLNVSPGYIIDMRDPREAIAADHPRDHSPMIEGETGKVVSATPTPPAPRRVPSPFPGYVETGTDRHGNPIFAPKKQKENDR